jgi:hypothetical protein
VDWTTWRKICLLTALGCAFGGTLSFAEVDADRPGGDYLSFVVPSGDPAVCSTRCEREMRCRAWSFSYPRTKTIDATCSLKERVVPRAADTCCVSGVKGAAFKTRDRKDVEFGIDRPGSDYSIFDVPANAHGEPCAGACSTDQRCRAWTYLRPGYEGNSARCFLKSRVMVPRTKPCCLSGVVR